MMIVPAHSKFAARCRKTSGTNPTLGRTDINAGHGAGKSVAATIQENVDAKPLRSLNMDYDHPCK
jgi:prolyl oligopeptidase